MLDQLDMNVHVAKSSSQTRLFETSALFLHLLPFLSQQKETVYMYIMMHREIKTTFANVKGHILELASLFYFVKQKPIKHVAKVQSKVPLRFK